jgi:hypothetical protein
MRERRTIARPYIAPTYTVQPMMLTPTRGRETQRLGMPESRNTQQMTKASSAGTAQIAASLCIDARATNVLPEATAASARSTRRSWYWWNIPTICHERRTSAIKPFDHATSRSATGRQRSGSLLARILPVGYRASLSDRTAGTPVRGGERS